MFIANVTGPGHSHSLAPTTVSPDVDVFSVERRVSAFPRSDADLLLLEVAAVEAATRAERAGCSAVFMNSVLDYGLAPARAVTRIPVVGAGQATLLAAAQLGRRFAIVTVWPESTRHLHERRLREYELADRCAGLRFVAAEREMEADGAGETLFERMHNRRPGIVDRVTQAIQDAARDGADVVVLGCTCMSSAAADLAARAPIPVIDSLAVGWSATESLARQRLAHSATAHPEATDGLTELFDAMVGAAASAQSQHEPVDECEGACLIGGAPTAAAIA